MPFRPSYIPLWAFGVTGPTNVVEPAAFEKAAGWSAGQAPPHGYMNWLQRGAGDWLNYLAYERLVDEDFCGYLDAFNPQSGTASTWSATSVLGAKWSFSPNNIPAPALDPNPGVMGVVNFSSLLGGTAYMAQSAGTIGARDFIVDQIAAMYFLGVGISSQNATGVWEVGLLDDAYFSITGPSQQWTFNWRPSGLLTPSPTFVNMNVFNNPVCIGPTGITNALGLSGANVVPKSGFYHRFWIERQGNTTYVGIDNTQQAIPMPAYLGASGVVKAGQRVTAGAGGANLSNGVWCAVFMDKVVVGVKR